MRSLGTTAALVLGTGVLLALSGCGTTGPGDASGGETPQGSASPSHAPTEGFSPTGMRGRLVSRLQIAGVPQPLFVTREDHPRGGRQLHAYIGGGAGEAVTELVDAAGNPIVSFVADDTRPSTHVSVSCTSGGLEVLEATPTQPSGVLVAWDIDRTTYRVDRHGAHATGHKRVGTSVPERTLRSDWADLAHDRMFVGCRKYGGPVR